MADINIYRYTFAATCPNNGQTIFFDLEIRTEKMIMVEHIITACSLHKKALHEHIANDLKERFGGVQTLKAHHHGVHIETIREAV